MNMKLQDSISQHASQTGPVPRHHNNYYNDSTYVMPVVPDSLCYKPTLLFRPKVSAKGEGHFDLNTKFYEDHFQSKDHTHYYRLDYEPTGYKGTPNGYQLYNDNGIAGFLLLLFLGIAYIFYNGRKHILDQIKGIFHVQDTGSLSTINDVRYGLFLRFSTSTLLGLLVFIYFKEMDPSMPLQYLCRYEMLGAYISIFILYFVAKRLSYYFLGWIFFDKQIRKSWNECYSASNNLLGFVLFPLVLLIIYTNFSLHFLFWGCIIMVMLSEILMFYKGLNLFMKNIYGFLYIILYLCTLEIIPLFILLEVLSQVNIILLIKL